MSGDSHEAGNVRGDCKDASVPEGVHWSKVPIVGMPGTECGRVLLEGATTEVQQDFKDEFGPCEEAGRWMVGMMFVCQKHAAIVAEELGDSIEAIERELRDIYA